MNTPLISKIIVIHLLLLASLHAGYIKNCSDNNWQSDITTAYADPNCTGVAFSAQTYYLTASGTGKGAWHLQIQNQTRPFTIDATGSTIYCDSFASILEIANCSNISWTGGTFVKTTTSNNNCTLPYSQGTVMDYGSDSNGTYIDIAIHQGYPNNVTDTTYFATLPSLTVFTPGTQSVHGSIKPGIPDIDVASNSSGNPWVVQNGAFFKFYLKNMTYNQLKALPITTGSSGDWAAWRGTVLYTFNLRNCSNIKVTNVTLEGAPGMGFQEMGGDGGNVYTGCSVTYPPPPVNALANQLPLLSSNADAFNSTGQRVGPQFLNCLAEGPDDDTFAVGGFYALAYQPMVGNTMYITAPGVAPGDQFCKTNDVLRVYDENGHYQGTAKVTAFTLNWRTPPGPPASTPPPPPASDTYFVNNAGSPQYYSLTLDTVFSGCQNGWMVSNQNKTGGAFKIDGCIARNTRGRLLLKGDNGTVSNCNISNTVQPGILLFPEAQQFGESDYAHNVDIVGNTISNVGLGRNGALGAVSVACGSLNNNGYYYATYGFDSVIIENNLFENNNGVNILLSSGNNVQVKSNTFLNPMQSAGYTPPSNPGSVDYTAMIWATESNAPILNGNVVANRNSTYMTTMAESTASVQNPIGFAAGDIPNLTTAIDQLSGGQGANWTSSGWQALSGSYGIATAAISTASPLETWSGQYLSTSVQTNSNGPGSGAVWRSFNGSTTAIDVSKPHQFMFDVRIDNVTSDMRYFIFDQTGSSATTNTNSACTWEIIGTSSGWLLLDGNSSGGVAGTVSTASILGPIVQGAVYRFVVTVNPAQSTWTADITTGTTTYMTPTSQPLHFRAAGNNDGSILEFGASTNNVNATENYSFSVDNISILNNITPPWTGY